MMKKWLLFLVLTTVIFAQSRNLIDDNTNISVAKTDNPAWLISKYNGDFQNYEIAARQAAGDYKLPYEPQEIWDFNYIARGEKKLFERGLFSGYVAFHQHRLVNKKWAHNRSPYMGFPFLLADSSMGDMALNGIHWQLGYSHELIPDKLFLGSRLFYNVDEEMKDVFPKPIIKHRDMMFSLGIGTKLFDPISAGLQYSYFDFQENLRTSKYSLNQDQTPLFFKVRGLDNPLIFRGETSEERKQDYTGHNFQFDTKMTGRFVKEINVLLEYETGHMEAVDGGAYPVDQGKMATEVLAFTSNAIFPFIGFGEIKISAFGEKHHYTADHPDMNIEIYEYKTERLGGGFEFLLPLNKNIIFKPAVFGSSQFVERIDKFNGILQYFPFTSAGPSLGLLFPNIGRLAVDVNAGVLSTLVGDSEIYVEKKNWYYNEITADEADWYNSDKMQYTLKSRLTYQLTGNKCLILDIDYLSGTASSNTSFDGKQRNGLTVGLKIEFKNE